MCKQRMSTIISDHASDLAVIGKLLGWNLISDSNAVKAAMQLNADMLVELHKEAARVESEPVIPGMTGGDIRPISHEYRQDINGPLWDHNHAQDGEISCLLGAYHQGDCIWAPDAHVTSR